MTYTSEINKTLSSLKNQGIFVSPGIVGSHGFVHDVMGFMLTHRQILMLYKEERLNPHGIREFAKNFQEQNETSRS